MTINKTPATLDARPGYCQAATAGGAGRLAFYTTTRRCSNKASTTRAGFDVCGTHARTKELEVCIKRIVVDYGASKPRVRAERVGMTVTGCGIEEDMARYALMDRADFEAAVEQRRKGLSGGA